jgi:hypothetical protein
MALVRTEVSEECIATIIRVKTITLMMETIRFSETSVLNEPQGVISQTTALF